MKYNDKAGEDCFYVGKAVMQNMLTAAKEGKILKQMRDIFSSNNQ
ncbi:hypothetical protein VPHD85_0073 [Vibrio phage D85]|nr:hypothetical protein PODOV033v1_p0051 [Vibrio phage 252E42.2]